MSAGDFSIQGGLAFTWGECRVHSVYDPNRRRLVNDVIAESPGAGRAWLRLGEQLGASLELCRVQAVVRVRRHEVCIARCVCVQVIDAVHPTIERGLCWRVGFRR